MLELFGERDSIAARSPRQQFPWRAILFVVALNWEDNNFVNYNEYDSAPSHSCCGLRPAVGGHGPDLRANNTVAAAETNWVCERLCRRDRQGDQGPPRNHADQSRPGAANSVRRRHRGHDWREGGF